MTAKSISKICSVDGCGRRSVKRGYCETDYHRFRKTPEFRPLHNRGIGLNPEERFWSRVRITPDVTQCWEWQGHTNHGYGVVRVNGRHTKTHRAAWLYTYGEMPKLYILHSCDNRACVNPNHLREGTYQDNSDDKVARNRQALGEATNRGHLTENDIRAIRANTFSETQVALAARFQVCRRTISDIQTRKTWRHC